MKNYIKNYPRPQFVRNKWVNLNGDWNFHLLFHSIQFRM